MKPLNRPWHVALSLALSAGVLSAVAADEDQLFVAASDGAKVPVGTSGQGCRLGMAAIQQRLRPGFATTASGQQALFVIPALAVADPKSSGTASGATSRLVVVDRRCKISHSLTDYYVAPPAYLYAVMAEAMNSGFLDVQGSDGKWGSWNLRTDRWDPLPCCGAPAHSAILLAATQRDRDAVKVATASSPLAKIWELTRPLVLIYMAVAGICLIIAASLGHRGSALVGQGLVVIPLRSVWLVIAIAIAANVYAIAGLLGSGALTGVASATISSATRSWRK